MTAPVERALAIETATAATAAALRVGDDVTEAVLDDARRHTEALALGVAALLAAAGTAAGDLQLVAVDVGPGLFTGLRVGIAFAKAVCLATGAALVGVRSTDVLGLEALEAGAEAPWAVVDARRGEVFAARYGAGPLGPVALEGPLVWAPGDLAARCGPGAVAVGDGALRHRATLEAAGVVVRDGTSLPRPALALRLAEAALAAGGPPDPAAVRPLYLREADATANFTVRGAR